MEVIKMEQIEKDEKERQSQYNIGQAFEDLFKATQINTTLIWMAATMAVIAAINSLTGTLRTIIAKSLVFMAISLVSLWIYNKRYKK